MKKSEGFKVIAVLKAKRPEVFISEPVARSWVDDLEAYNFADGMQAAQNLGRLDEKPTLPKLLAEIERLRNKRAETSSQQRLPATTRMPSENMTRSKLAAEVATLRMRLSCAKARERKSKNINRAITKVGRVRALAQVTTHEATRFTTAHMASIIEARLAVPDDELRREIASLEKELSAHEEWPPVVGGLSVVRG